MTNAKMTYVKALDYVLGMNGVVLESDVVDIPEDVVERLTALKATLEKRGTASRKPTKTQKENESVKAQILDILSSDGRQCGEIANAVGISGQKCSALLKQLVESGDAEKFVEKRVTYFRAVERG